MAHVSTQYEIVYIYDNSDLCKRSNVDVWKNHKNASLAIFGG